MSAKLNEMKKEKQEKQEGNRKKKLLLNRFESLQYDFIARVQLNW